MTKKLYNTLTFWPPSEVFIKKMKTSFFVQFLAQ